MHPFIAHSFHEILFLHNLARDIIWIKLCHNLVNYCYGMYSMRRLLRNSCLYTLMVFVHIPLLHLAIAFSHSWNRLSLSRSVEKEHLAMIVYINNTNADILDSSHLWLVVATPGTQDAQSCWSSKSAPRTGTHFGWDKAFRGYRSLTWWGLLENPHEVPTPYNKNPQASAWVIWRSPILES